MTDPAAAPEYREKIARQALEAYKAWIDDETGQMMMPFQAVGEAMSCTRWLLDMLESRPETGPKITGKANTAIKHLGAREMRDVLSALAVRCPAAVLDAIAETGH